jgi:hypothetical protein
MLIDETIDRPPLGVIEMDQCRRPLAFLTLGFPGRPPTKLVAE